MIVDASAILAIVLGEADRELYYAPLGISGQAAISAVNYVEAGIKADEDRTAGRGKLLDEMLQRFGVEVAAVTREEAAIARDAYRRFGKGKHPARLNFGDCFAFALAKSRGEALLFKGDDFSHPDVLAEIESAL